MGAPCDATEAGSAIQIRVHFWSALGVSSKRDTGASGAASCANSWPMGGNMGNCPARRQSIHSTLLTL